jgi:hypothetical protein
MGETLLVLTVEINSKRVLLRNPNNPDSKGHMYLQGLQHRRY